VFDREFVVSNREKTLVQREEAFALEVVGFAAQRSDLETRLATQRSELETRSQGLEIRKLELDELSGTLVRWRKQLEERATKLAIAESELEEDRKSLYKRESHATNMEKQLGIQRDSLKKMKESAEKRKAELEERSREVEAAKAALDTRVQEVVQKLQEDQRLGAQRIVDWAGEASLALVPFGMSPIQVAEAPASIADALPVLSSASDRLRRLEPVLAGQLEAEGRELIRMVEEHILICLRSHDPSISLTPMLDGPVAETEAAARDSVREVVDFIAAYFKREPADS
jgi:DNA repair exonuclease SbcCD ATPase subunit